MPDRPALPDQLAPDKFELLTAVFERSKAQRTALESDDLATFLALLDERDELLAQLQQLADETPELPDNVVALPSELNDRTRHDDRLALDTLIRGIVQQDEGNEAMLSSRLEQLAGEVPTLRHGRGAAAAYRVQTEPQEPQGYIDRVS